jgi:biotin transporter BioY
LSPTVGFVAAFVLTLVLLGLAVQAGRRAQRKKHIYLVAGAVCGLGGTIWYALQLGKIYDLETAGIITPIHLTMAKITTAAYALPIAFGLMTLRKPAMRPVHKVLAYVVLVMTVLCAITGTIMILRADRLPQ